MIPNPRSTLLLALLAAFGQSALASEDDLFFGELPMVASVSRLPQRSSETPAAVTVIDQEIIRASGARTVEDLLRLVPGFQVTSHNQDPAIVTYHGLTGSMSGDEFGTRVQVLVDGRSQYSPLFKSGVNWNLLPVALEDIERIEVTRGANTVSYGSNAFMGVINIITLDASQTRGWTLAANHGNNGIRDQLLRWGGKAGEADVRLTARQFSDDGFQHGSYGNAWLDEIDSRRSGLIDFRANLQLNNRDELQFTLSHAEDASQYGRPVHPVNGPYLQYPVRDLNQSSTALGVQWRRVVSPDEEIKLRYAYTEDWASGAYLEQAKFNAMLCPSTSTSGSDPCNGVANYAMRLDPGGKASTNELEFTHALKPFETSRLLWGASLKTIAVSSEFQYSTTSNQHRTLYRGFGNFELRPDTRWLFNLGASLEHDSITGTNFDPRAGVSYHVTPENTLRLIASRAHRTPSLYEARGYSQKVGQIAGNNYVDITYLGQGNPDPERIDSVEVGYLGEFKELRASIDVRAFRERIPNRLIMVPVALPASMPDDREWQSFRINPLNNVNYPFGRADSAVNLENVTIHGYEYQARWQPFESTRLIFNNSFISIDAHLTDESQVADSADVNTSKISRQTRESAPRHAQSAMLIQKLPYDFLASVMYYRTGPLRWRRNNPTENDNAERFDWRLAKTLKLGPTRAEIAYTVQMANESQQGRQIFRVADKLQWLSLSLSY